MSSTLMAHSGARLVTREQLRGVPTPEGTATWFPLAHDAVVSAVAGKLSEAGYMVEREQHALARSDARYFGILDLSSDLGRGVKLAVGIRSSHDKSLPIGFCAGSRVFVCDNLSFHAEVVIARKHTRNGETRYSEALAHAVGSLAAFREGEAKRIEQMRQTPLTSLESDAVMLRAYERGIVSARLLPDVIGEYRTPSHAEFNERNAWSLFNAFTGAMAPRLKSNAQQYASVTLALGGLFGEFLGLPASETPAALAS